MNIHVKGHTRKSTKLAPHAELFTWPYVCGLWFSSKKDPPCYFSLLHFVPSHTQNILAHSRV